MSQHDLKAQDSMEWARPNAGHGIPGIPGLDQGLLISFEGIDGCGKTTQISKLIQALEPSGRPVRVYREPGGTPISEQIRSMLLDPDNDLDPVSEVLLFSAARSELVVRDIIPALQMGAVVILDRFFDSTTAYQGYGHGVLDPERLDAIHRLAAHGLQPDVTFYLRISLEQASERTAGSRKDRMESMGDSFFTRVIQGYDLLASRHPRFITLDASLAIDDLHARILADVMARLDRIHPSAPPG